MYCVYILHSTKLNRFYIGYTSDFETRLEFHKQAASRKFTAKSDDWTVFLEIPCDSKTQGLNIEKTHQKNEKQNLYRKSNKISRNELEIT